MHLKQIIIVLLFILPIFLEVFFIHLKLELLTQILASNDEKYDYVCKMVICKM